MPDCSSVRAARHAGVTVDDAVGLALHALQGRAGSFNAFDVLAVALFEAGYDVHTRLRRSGARQEERPMWRFARSHLRYLHGSRRTAPTRHSITLTRRRTGQRVGGALAESDAQFARDVAQRVCDVNALYRKGVGVQAVDSGRFEPAGDADLLAARGAVLDARRELEHAQQRLDGTHASDRVLDPMRADVHERRERLAAAELELRRLRDVRRARPVFYRA